MHLYLTDSSVKVGLSSGRLTVKKAEDDTAVRDIPFEDVEDISVFGMAQLSTQLLRACIQSDVPVLFYSEDGHYFGHLSSGKHVDPARQRSQVYASDDAAFCLRLSRSIVDAKLTNSLAMLHSLPEVFVPTEKDIQGLVHSKDNLCYAETVSQVMGFEGNGAKAYFACLSKLLISDEFAFSGRSTQPPRDPVNSMLSFGYSIAYRNIIGAIEAAGLNPYFAFLHAVHQGHAALASDLVEEWRAWLVDRLVVNLINSGEVAPADFYANDTGAIYMQKPLMRKLTDVFGDAMLASYPYFASQGDGKRYGFQIALRRQIYSLILAIEQRNPVLYQPFVWDEQLNARDAAQV